MLILVQEGPSEKGFLGTRASDCLEGGVDVGEEKKQLVLGVSRA